MTVTSHAAHAHAHDQGHHLHHGGGHSHGGGGHGHSHGPGLVGWLGGTFADSHDVSDKVDAAMERDERAIWALKEHGPGRPVPSIRPRSCRVVLLLWWQDGGTRGQTTSQSVTSLLAAAWSCSG